MRLKFLLFALLVVGLWLGALAAMSSSLGQSLMEQGGRQAQAAAAAVVTTRSEQRASLATLALSIPSAPPVLAAAKRGNEPEKLFDAIKTAVTAAAPESVRKDLLVALVNEGNSFSAQGASESPAEGLDLPTLAKAGADGVVSEVGGAEFQFVGVPLFSLAGAEPKPAGTAVVGLPLMPKGAPDQIAKELGLSALVVLEGGKVIAQGGPAKGGSWNVQEISLGGVDVVERGPAATIGPIQLPLLTQADPLGGRAPLAMGSRQALQGTPYEILAVISLKPMMRGLADGQQVALLALAGLLSMSFVWALLLGEKAAPRTQAEKESDPSAKAAAKGQVLKIGYDASANAPAPPVSTLGTVEPAPPPEPNPDDFQFPPAPISNRPPAPTPYDLPPVPDSALPPPVGAGEADPYAQFDSDHVPTKAYPIAPGPEDGGDPYGEPPTGETGYNPDATRVAAVSDELLRAARDAAAGQQYEQPRSQAAVPPPPRSAALTPPPVANGSGDEAHFQDVFRDFVTTRERCGEAADGLTFDKFAMKLRKNREQLVQKYNCRTVRFQVYVKEGKAALKATPVKD